MCKDAVALLSKDLLNLLGNGGHRAATAEEEVVAFTVPLGISWRPPCQLVMVAPRVGVVKHPACRLPPS